MQSEAEKPAMACMICRYTSWQTSRRAFTDTYGVLSDVPAHAAYDRIHQVVGTCCRTGFPLSARMAWPCGCSASRLAAAVWPSLLAAWECPQSVPLLLPATAYTRWLAHGTAQASPGQPGWPAPGDAHRPGWPQRAGRPCRRPGRPCCLQWAALGWVGAAVQGWLTRSARMAWPWRCSASRLAVAVWPSL